MPEEAAIEEVLELWKENNEALKQLAQKDELLRNKIRVFMKEKRWDKYNDKTTKVNVSIIKQKIETIDTTQLKLIMSEAQQALIKKVSIVEKMLITTSKDRERMKKYMKNGR